jgi:probable rRNA maturation factor
MIALEIIVEAPGWAPMRAAIETAVARAAAAAAMHIEALRGDASLLLADDARLSALNQQFRRKAGPTNVLSFPSGEARGGFLGDIAIAFETAQREAGECGAPLVDYVVHLALHGLLHLVGYDHETEEEAAIMEGREAALLDELGVYNPYAPGPYAPGPDARGPEAREDDARS